MPHRPLLVVNMNDLLRNNVNNNDVRYPLIHMRDTLFHTVFVKVALLYARGFSVKERKIIEFLLLSLAFLSFALLIYIHLAFVQNPSDCLAHVQDKWPKDGILRVEILQGESREKYSLEKSYLKERRLKELAYEDLASYFFFSSGLYDDSEEYKALLESVEASEGLKLSNFTNNSSYFALNGTMFSNTSADEMAASGFSDKLLLSSLAWSDEVYIMEFSLEYGFLKLSPSVRKKYNITVELFTLDPATDKCFGGPLNNFILYNFLGYDEVLLASLKLLASKEEYKVYVRNVVSDVEYMFVNVWMDGKSYIMAGFVMMVFTVSISILLRYSHHQIFVFIVEMLHMVEFHSPFNFPAGPLLTVVLALVGMEAIMSEFFNDTAIAFYVILIVWVADQFDTICCKSVFTKKHWLRFFYLYHFFFYAYSHRFGHNKFLALLTSWLFTLHSMFYFVHRYELPILLARQQQARNQNLSESNENDPPDPSDGDHDETPPSHDSQPVTPPSENQSDSIPNNESVSSNQDEGSSINETASDHYHSQSVLPANSMPQNLDEISLSKKYLCELSSGFTECSQPVIDQKSYFRKSKLHSLVVLFPSLHFIISLFQFGALLLTFILITKNIALVRTVCFNFKILLSYLMQFLWQPPCYVI